MCVSGFSLKKLDILIFYIIYLKTASHFPCMSLSFHSKMFKGCGKNLGKVGQPETHIFLVECTSNLLLKHL